MLFIGPGQEGKAVRRDVFKFVSAVFAGFAVEHALIAVFIAQGALNQPHYFGREWGPQSAVFGAAMYLALSIWLGWLGWRTPPPATEMPNNETGNITT